jgi:transmembrane sensor
MNKMENEKLGQYFTQQPNQQEDNKIGVDPEMVAQAQKVIDQINLLRQMEEIDSHKALQQVKIRIGRNRKVSFISLMQKAAAVLLIPLLAFALWQTFRLNNIEENITLNEIATPPTLRSVFTLPDGTQVWLNGGTSLKYPVRFSGKERLVELDGEAFFKVSSQKDKPFVVKSGDYLIEAVGTEFNSKAFSSEQKIETVLTEGKINIVLESPQGRKTMASLEPNQMVTYYRSDKKIIRRKADTTKHLSWMKGKIIFRNDHIDEVLNRLEHWYNIEFVIDSKVDLDYAFTGSFESEELKQLLRYIELTTPVTFSYSGTVQSSDNQYAKTKIEIKPKQKK